MIVALLENRSVQVLSSSGEYVLSGRNDVFNHRRLLVGGAIPIGAIAIFSLAKNRSQFNIGFMASSPMTNLLQNNINVSSNQLRDLLTFMRLDRIVGTCVIAEVLQINDLIRCLSAVDWFFTYQCEGIRRRCPSFDVRQRPNLKKLNGRTSSSELLGSYVFGSFIDTNNGLFRNAQQPWNEFVFTREFLLSISTDGCRVVFTRFLTLTRKKVTP